MTLKEYLRPYSIVGDRLMRFGRLADGGYILSEQAAKSIKYCYTYGVANEISFELQLNAFNPNIEYHLYDHTVDGFQMPSNFFFHKEGLGGAKTNELDNFLNHFNTNGHVGKELETLLKLDAEGGEFDFLEAVTADQLKDINSMIIEFHWIDRHMDKFLRCMDKLKENFDIVHIHPNNCGFEFTTQDGFVFPNVPELTLLNRKYYKIGLPMHLKYPILGLDYKNEPSKGNFEINFQD